MTSNLPLYEQYRIAGLEWTDAEAAASLLEDLKSSFLAEMMGNLMDTEPKLAVNRAEQTVKASQEWQDHVTSIVEARKVANRCKVQLEYLRMRHQEYLSTEANNRLEAKL
jgi:hypothetical protein